MKKILSCIIAMVIIGNLFAGGLVTNSNQSATYYRMLARGASFSGDAVYYNPAGLAFLDQGLTISLNTQMIWMKRTLTNDLGTLNNSEFIGKLYVPVFPGAYAAYKTGNWTFSLGFNPPAGGGSIEFADGLPMLENNVSLIPKLLDLQGLSTDKYSLQSMLNGTSIVYSVQAGATYRVSDMLGVFGGIRMSFASNSYEGYVKDIKINPYGNMVSAPDFFENAGIPSLLPLAQATANQSLDVKQAGSGMAPILGFHFNMNSLNLSAKYEFSTKITLKNETKQNAMNMYPDGQKLRSDVPALLSLAGSYDIIPSVKLSFTYLYHFEPQATIESWAPDAANPNGGSIVQRQDFIDRGTNEYMAGLEWKLNDKLILSTGCQWSDVSVSDLWQNDISHNLDNLTIGLGAAYHFSDRLILNIGGINTWYNSSSIKGNAAIQGTPVTMPYTQTYERANTAIAIGIDYRF